MWVNKETIKVRGSKEYYKIKMASLSRLTCLRKLFLELGIHKRTLLLWLSITHSLYTLRRGPVVVVMRNTPVVVAATIQECKYAD
jgi:hypothetical protein